MDCTCSICGRKKYKPPFTDKRKVIDMCPDCQRDQDKFLEEMIDKEKRIKEYKNDHHV